MAFLTLKFDEKAWTGFVLGAMVKRPLDMHWGETILPWATDRVFRSERDKQIHDARNLSISLREIIGVLKDRLALSLPLWISL